MTKKSMGKEPVSPAANRLAIAALGLTVLGCLSTLAVMLIDPDDPSPSKKNQKAHRDSAVHTAVRLDLGSDQRFQSSPVRMGMPQGLDITTGSDPNRFLLIGLRCVRGTYRRAQMRNPGLGGKMALCLIVNATGKNSSVDISRDTVGDASLATNVARCFKRLRMPPQEKGEATICFPLSFIAP